MAQTRRWLNSLRRFHVITACGHRLAHRKWKETKLQPGTAGPGNMLGSCLVSLHFLWAILYPQAVQDVSSEMRLGFDDLDFKCSTLYPTLPGLMGIWQKRLDSWARGTSQIKVNPTQVSAHLGHPVSGFSLSGKSVALWVPF